MKETFGQRFQRLRKEKALTQQDIADKVNITFQSVSKWEQDINLPDVNTLVQLSKILGVSIDVLLGNDEPVVTIEESNSNKILKIQIINEDDKVTINLPLKLVRTLVSSGSKVPGLGNNDIDFESLFELIDQGVVGEILNIETKTDNIIIFVE